MQSDAKLVAVYVKTVFFCVDIASAIHHSTLITECVKKWTVYWSLYSCSKEVTIIKLEQMLACVII